MYHHVAVSGWRTGGTLWGRCRLVRHQSHDDSRRAGRDRRPTERKTGEGAGTQLALTPLWLLCWRQPQPKQTTIPVSNIQPTNHASSHSLLPDRGDTPTFSPAEDGTRLSDPRGMQGWDDLVGLLYTEIVYPPEDGHHPSTNRARRALT